MLNKETFIKGLMILSTMKNPIDRKDKFTIDVWYEALKDIPNDAYIKACTYLLKTSVWHPAVAEIREAAGFACDVQSGTHAIAEQQWEVFTRTFSSYGTNRMRTAFIDSNQIFEDPTTQHVAEIIFEDYGRSMESEAGNWRARFISTYNNVKQNGRRTAEMQSIGNGMMNMLSGQKQKAVTA